MTKCQGLTWKGLVLAGGLSSRMGTNKAALILNGKTLLARAVDSLSEIVGRENVLVSGPGIGFIPDLIPGLGPLGGIWASTARIDSNDWLLVVPVDMPCLASSALEKLTRVAEVSEENGVRAVHFSGYELPLAFRADEGARRVLMELCSSGRSAGERSIHAFLGRIEAIVVKPDEGWGGYFRNVNFPSDWSDLKG